MSLLLLSVQHTGTRFLRDALQQAGVEVKTEHISRAGVEQAMKEQLVTSPLRNPVKVWKSWWRRHGASPVSPLEGFNAQWKLLRELSERRHVLFVPIDHPDRELYATLLCGQVQQEVEFDWDEQVGHGDGHVEFSTPPEVDLSVPFSIPIVKELYG